MQHRSRILAVAVVLTFLASAASGREPAPTPRPPHAKADEKPKREDLPTCASKRVSIKQMREAFDRVAAKKGDDTVRGKETFDEIGDELGCRWPVAGEEGGQGLIEMLERGGMRVEKQ
jgi:hypothetical protein